jgi:hypothetical protein
MDTPGKQHVPHWIVYNRDSQTNKHLVVFIARIGQGRSISHIGCVIQYGNTQLKADMMTIHIFVVCKKKSSVHVIGPEAPIGPTAVAQNTEVCACCCLPAGGGVGTIGACQQPLSGPLALILKGSRHLIK